jgi:hypothetical protein
MREKANCCNLSVNRGHSKEFLKRAQQKFEEEYTFQPKINDKSKEVVEVKTKLSKEERFKILTEPNKEK